MTQAVRDPLATRVREQTRWFGALLVGLLLIGEVWLPWRMAGVAIAVAALWIGLRLLRSLATLRRLGRPNSGWVGVTVGLGFVMLVLLQLGAEAVVYPLVADREQCTAKASSLTARRLCQVEFDRRLAQLRDRVGGGG